ncbi:ATP-dependent zinc protease family protein [Porticoccus sp.]|uniref:ATP-dependent zinc protease family protein n=1 Tax=Porticoccus sp. TaxID=2024853 RepID=UPI003F698427
MRVGLLVSFFGLLLVLAGCTQVQSQSESSPGVVEEPPKVDLAPVEPLCPAPPPCPVCQVPAIMCPELKIVEKIVVKTVPATAGELNLPIIGEIENVFVDPPGIKLEARIDSGAETSSIHAENIQVVERDGIRYVRFVVPNPETGESIDLVQKLTRTVLIKRKVGEPERRYVVRLWITMGEIKENIEVTLSDREDFEFSFLVGRNLLTDTAIVDVSRKHTLK